MPNASDSIVAPFAGYVHVRSAHSTHLVGTAKILVRWTWLGPRDRHVGSAGSRSSVESSRVGRPTRLAPVAPLRPGRRLSQKCCYTGTDIERVQELPEPRSSALRIGRSTLGPRATIAGRFASHRAALPAKSHALGAVDAAPQSPTTRLPTRARTARTRSIGHPTTRGASRRPSSSDHRVEDAHRHPARSSTPVHRVS